MSSQLRRNYQLSIHTLLLISLLGAFERSYADSTPAKDSDRQPAFASSPEVWKIQIQSDVMGSIEKNRSSKTFGEFNTGGYSPKDVFSNVRALRESNAWIALCQTLDALPPDSLALFENEIHKPESARLLPCASALKTKLTQYWRDNANRLRQHLATLNHKPKTGKSNTALEERKVSISESPIVTRSEIKEHEIAITFNDGPDPVRTPKILDILKSTSVRATFFHVGEQIRARPEIDHRLVDERHTLGSHTFGHIDLSRADLKKAEKQIIKGREEAEAASGVDVPFFRPPYGALNDEIKEILKKRKMPVFQWSIDSLDWKLRDTRSLYDHLLQAIETEKGGVLLFHESQESALSVLRPLIDELKSRGFTFVVFIPSN
jgi:peptidoglycan/xylan/chitin deacetylase (PgdA/CDA1 family)